MTRTIYDAAADEMELLLIANDIKYTRKRCYEGWQFFIDGTDGDVVCHRGSYGGNDGLWESMGFVWDEGDVTGRLTAKDIVRMLKENYGM